MNYKGQLSGFPKKVVDLMVKRQVEQGNPVDVSVFEEYLHASKDDGGFNWDGTPEGESYWGFVIECEQFNLVPEPNEYPKVMLVWEDDKNPLQREVIMEINGGYLAWSPFTKNNAVLWPHAKDIEPEQIELTIDQIADKFGVDPNQIKIKK